ncbi:antitoxin [uncultured Sphingomonas sp.]|uniref:antitoxin n=1 Tax=uncultured Sphingomonas sp. TaxID=158754 RepID=UPI0035CB0249
MKHEPAIFEQPDPKAIAAMDAEAEADIEAGRVVPHEKVRGWLQNWGKPDEQPMPPEWLR